MMMELKHVFRVAFVLFLLSAASLLCFAAEETEIYEIDYRGPETHSHASRPWIHHRRTKEPPRPTIPNAAADRNGFPINHKLGRKITHG